MENSQDVKNFSGKSENLDDISLAGDSEVIFMK